MFSIIFKSTVSILLCYFLMSHSSFAKVYSTCPYPQHEVGVGYGYLSNDQLAIGIFNAMGLGILKPIADLELKNEKYSYIGPISVNYKYFFKERLSIGASLIYSHTGMSYEDSFGKTFKNKFHTVSVLPRLDFYYLRNPKFALYGNIGVGVMMLKSSYDGIELSEDFGATLAFQVTPLAMRIGRDFGFVLELGIGSLGMANAGFSYRHYDRPWEFR